MSEPLREKIIKVLLETSPMRFSELFEEVGRPSRSHFSQELHNLQREGLVTREELDRKYVEYSLDRRAYHLKLMNEQLKLNEKLQKAQM